MKRFVGTFRAIVIACLAFVTAFGLGVAGVANAAELIMFEQEGCPWCERWDEEIGEIYHKTDEGKRAPLRRVDIHQEMPQDLAGIASESFTPSFVLVDNGEEIGRIRGYPGADFFWWMLAEIMEKLDKKQKAVSIGSH